MEGQTIGKKMLGIRIVNYHDGDNPGFVQAVLLRSCVTFLLANFIPFFSMIDACFIFTDERRCVHDLLANTTVIAD
ncbi:MAG: RDD family protein [Planctomycetota bacterium]|nr:RDD family protein [Planctomycetota bacterium]